MKQTLLFTLLLGFGFMAPMNCAKDNDKKSSSDESKKQEHLKKQTPKQMALYGPVGAIKLSQQGIRLS